MGEEKTGRNPCEGCKEDCNQAATDIENCDKIKGQGGEAAVVKKSGNPNI